MANDRTLIIKVIKGSKEDKWLQAQKNQSGSIRALIRTASRQIGDTDLREFLEDTGIDRGDFQLNGNSPTHQDQTQKAVESKHPTRNSDNKSSNKNNEPDYDEIMKGLSS
ncbi:hypothetical protein A3Q05_02155 [Lactobacillus johnsonii]|uniref:hypothetical protein n=1 Tax=Lactobacillus johnsonii TaxID=33959 RepID=UPI000BA478B3|nr:hypothetical protein [Lactobacillus johnsonii]PAB56835.1 hypothetical protein A3Q05_02155 [Lactobacillus johnsonii]PEG68843.1 hypothetical protein A3Q04_07575 [Lactobacillus johnsonii]